MITNICSKPAVTSFFAPEGVAKFLMLIKNIYHKMKKSRDQVQNVAISNTAHNLGRDQAIIFSGKLTPKRCPGFSLSSRLHFWKVFKSATIEG